METEARVKDPLSEVLDASQFHDGGTDLGEVNPNVARGRAVAGTGVVRSTAEIVTAQQVPVRRDIRRVLTNIKALAAAAGKDYVYGWEVKERKTGRKTWIEGPTIKLANDVAREYGNCKIDFRVEDQGSHWIFYALFADWETGFSMVRAFQQRKGQDTGMADAARQQDIVFQIGQSKAIRNVIVNALSTIVAYAMEEAKGAVFERVGKNPGKAREWILQTLKDINVDKKRVEAIYGRSADNWTVPDMSRIYSELQSVLSGMMVADEVFPVPQTEAAAKKAEDDSPLAAREPAASAPVGGAGHGPSQDSTAQQTGETTGNVGGGVPGSLSDAADAATAGGNEKATAKSTTKGTTKAPKKSVFGGEA